MEMERGGFHSYQKLSNTSSVEIINRHNSNSNVNNHLTALNMNNVNEENECTVREQDRYMPIANVIRIMRKILPPHAKISDDAKETIQECVSEYISFITSEANDRCQREQRKTITAEDVLYAMSKLGFDDYIEPLTIYLQRYREMEGERGGSMRGSESLTAVKRNNNNHLEFGSMLGIAAAAFPAAAATHHHQNGFFGGASASSAAAAAAAAAMGTYSSRELPSINATNSSSQPAWLDNGIDAFRHNKL